MNALVRTSLLLLACLSLPACISARFYPHEARENIHTGSGGSRFAVEGLDVWFIGAPDRRYEILGYIEDPVGATIDDQHRRISGTVLEKAREIGAQALIEEPIGALPVQSITSSMLFAPPYRRGTYIGIGAGFPPETRRIARYTAIRFLD